jgi:hypothetical protein
MNCKDLHFDGGAVKRIFNSFQKNFNHPDRSEPGTIPGSISLQLIG